MALVPRTASRACSTESMMGRLPWGFRMWWATMTAAPVSVASDARSPVAKLPAAGSAFTSAWMKEDSGSSTTSLRSVMRTIWSRTLVKCSVAIGPSGPEVTSGIGPPALGSGTTISRSGRPSLSRSGSRRSRRRCTSPSSSSAVSSTAAPKARTAPPKAMGSGLTETARGLPVATESARSSVIMPLPVSPMAARIETTPKGTEPSMRKRCSGASPA